MDILDEMGVSKLSAKVFFFKVNYSFNRQMKSNNSIIISVNLVCSVLFSNVIKIKKKYHAI